VVVGGQIRVDRSGSGTKFKTHYLNSHSDTGIWGNLVQVKLIEDPTYPLQLPHQQCHGSSSMFLLTSQVFQELGFSLK
jgi:hypothetical protein